MGNGPRYQRKNSKLTTDSAIDHKRAARCVRGRAIKILQHKVDTYFRHECPDFSRTFSSVFETVS